MQKVPVLLKVMSILNIVLGAIGCLGGLLALLGSLLIGVAAGGLGGTVAGVAVGGILVIATLISCVNGILMLVAGIQGVRYSQSRASAKPLILWGVIVALFNILGAALNTVNSGELSLTPILTGVAVPVLYIFGAAQSSKSDNT